LALAFVLPPTQREAPLQCLYRPLNKGATGMATIDLTDIITDPDFLDAITLIRTFVTVDDHGRAIPTESQRTILASVQPASAAALLLLPEASRLGSSLQIYTVEPLVSLQQSVYADRIVFQGSAYYIHTLNDYSNWGAGWVSAVCTMVPLVDADA
jgi:hypothetical protein